MRTRRLPYISLLLLALLAGGCARQRIAPKLAEPEAGWDGPTAVDIENYYGSVTVRVDPHVKSVKPVAMVRSSWTTNMALLKGARDSVSVATRTVTEGGRNVVRIRTSSTWKETSQVWVNLTVTMPRCDGVRIWNRGGKVTLIGVAGAVLVDNGARFGESGDIELRTDAPMIEPVALITGKGSVVYQIGGESSGQFELTTERGRVEFDSPIVRPDHFRATERQITAVLNNGDNQVVLKTGEGMVVVQVMEDAAAYTNRLRH